MKLDIRRVVAISVIAAIQITAGAAHAQVGNMLKGAIGGGSGSGGGDSTAGGGALGQLGGIGSGSSLSSLSSITSGSSGNTAGILQYCMQNNYLSGSSASSVKDKLVGKISGNGDPSANSGYADGAKGVLTTSSGQKLNLGGGNLKAQATKKICAKVLDQAKSMI